MPPVSDLAFGRGRQHDSSSSRESSPQPRKKMRPSSPGSDDDDGEGDIPPIVDDDTPPPPNRPLIRQAVAFGGDSAFGGTQGPAAIVTYQAKLQGPSQAMFLPGQAPVKEPPKPKKRRRKNDEFKAQSGRFRLEGYSASTPVPMTHPPPTPTGHGYDSPFRSVPDLQRSESPAGSFSGYMTSSGTLTDASVPMPARASSKGKNSTSGSRKSGTSRSSQSFPQIGQTTFSANPNTPSAGPSFVLQQPRQPIVAEPPPNNAHYRRDYDAGHPKRVKAAAGPSNSQPTNGEYYSDSPTTIDRQSQGHSSNATQKRSGPQLPLRMVTVLAQDVRSGEPDSQLIEVKVPLRTADDPSDGYWADAKEIVEIWQKGAGRVDGPARVYTLRGKYRQILLRVDASNNDTFTSTNVIVQRDRTIEVVIEDLPIAGVRPSAPRVPISAQPSQDTETPLTHALGSREKHSSGRSGAAHRRSPSHMDMDDEYDEVVPLRAHYRPSSSKSITKSPPSIPYGNHRIVERAEGVRAREPIASSARPRVDTIDYDSPDSDAEPDVVDEAIRKAVEGLIAKDPEWKNYFRWKAGLPTVTNVLHQYRFVRRLMDNHVGEFAPFRTKRFLIEDKHILGGLFIGGEDGKYASNVRETLDLLELYGRNGKRSEDPEVLKLLDDTSPPEYNAKPIKRLLHLLRDVDVKWEKEHPGVGKETERVREQPNGMRYSDSPHAVNDPS